MSVHLDIPTPPFLNNASNMSHGSNGDTNQHYSVQGETSNGGKVKGGHVPEDTPKQTVIFLLHTWK